MPVCTTPMCVDGRAAVAQMWSTFNYLKDNYPSFNEGYYLPTCESIQGELESVDSWYADLIPFNPTCCTIDEIGAQANVLTNQMLQSVGASDVPVPPPASDWTTTLVVGGLILLAIIYSPQIKKGLG